jgi:hypothetical protein
VGGRPAETLMLSVVVAATFLATRQQFVEQTGPWVHDWASAAGPQPLTQAKMWKRLVLRRPKLGGVNSLKTT